MKKEKRYLVPGDYMADPAVHVFNLRPVTFRTGGVAEGIVYCIISFYFQIYFFICPG